MNNKKDKILDWLTVIAALLITALMIYWLPKDMGI